MSERVSRQREERGAQEDGRMLGSWSPGTFICPWEGGALPTADSGFPSGFHHSRSRPTPHSGLLSPGSTHFAVLLGSSHPALGVWGREKTHTKASGW